MCDRLNKRDPPPRRGDGRDPKDGDKEKGKRGKGKGKGKGNKGGKNSDNKSWNKYNRDRERWRRWQTGKSRNRKPLCHRLFKEALTMGVAENTRKSTKARLNTWDTAMATLEEKGLVSPTDPTHLTPESVPCL